MPGDESFAAAFKHLIKGTTETAFRLGAGTAKAAVNNLLSRFRFENERALREANLLEEFVELQNQIVDLTIETPDYIQ